ncbi:MAG: methylmalonyl Co-A mutase-associated GTPase MeaB [Dehalococcoidia bacterium]|nr:methylmalonyl Co-A mutase-associated GTPase MeaB [Dehalococcoidia bacterium]
MAGKRSLKPESAKLLDDMLGGNVRALARLISMVEKQSPETPCILHEIYPRLKAHRVGITGPPGAGKSTIVDKLTQAARQKGLQVGVICSDPSSPFSGGAILGDRIRMQQHFADTGVFIRSMATRGSLGGLPYTAGNVAKLIDAFGKELVLIETVGVGQIELDIMENVDTVIVVLVPEAGDAIQAMKAGLMEIADIFVINKADRPGADTVQVEIENMLTLFARDKSWQVPVLTTEAVNNIGIDELYNQVWLHRTRLLENGQLERKRRNQRRNEFMNIVQKNIGDELVRIVNSDEDLKKYLKDIEHGKMEPYDAAGRISSKISWRVNSEREAPEKAAD